MIDFKRPQLAWGTWGFSYGVVCLLVAVLLVWLFHSRTETTTLAIQQAQRVAAQDELQAAADNTVTAARALLETLTLKLDRAEVVTNPQAAQAWLEERARAGFSAAAVGVAIYDAAGRLLVGSGSLQVPPQIDPNEGDAWVQRIMQRDYLMVLRSGSDQPAYSVVLAVDFFVALGRERTFRYTDPLSWELQYQADAQRLDAGELHRHLHSVLLGSPELDALMADLQVNKNYLAMAVIGLAILAYGLMHLMAGIPLKRLLREAATLRQGGIANDGHQWIAEFAYIREILADYQSRFDVMHSGLDRKNRRLWKLAYHDALTGCLNRRAFEDDWSHTLAITEGREVEVSVLLLSCDHFQSMNETYGHSVGDGVLRIVAATVQRVLRKGDRLYRLGADEFAVIFVDAGPGYVESLAAQCVAQLAEHNYRAVGLSEPLRLSIGVAHAQGSARLELNDLAKRAGVALFHAKQQLTGRVVVYHDELKDSIDILPSDWATNALDTAITRGTNIQMHYQPVVTLPDRQIVFYEALVRIESEGHLLEPGNIFALIEQRGLECEFDRAVLAAIVRDMEAGRIPGDAGVSINVSGASLVDIPTVERIRQLVPFAQRRMIVLEIIETALITQLELASKRLRELRTQGLLVALDDFGSGYSSLRYLADMPVDIVKFDIGLIHAMCSSEPQAELMQNLARLVGQAGYRMVAEGVESEKILQKVVDIGFEFAQGRLLGSAQRMLAGSELTAVRHA